MNVYATEISGCRVKAFRFGFDFDLDLFFQQDDGGWTPLVWACENKHEDVIK